MKMVEYYEVARMAGCPSTPEGKDSDGARWLMRVYEDAKNIRRTYDFDDYPNQQNDFVAEVADGSVPIYTNELWNIWVDCGGYNNDDGQYRDFARANDTGDIMNRIAQADCYEWATNIIYSVVRDME